MAARDQGAVFVLTPCNRDMQQQLCREMGKSSFGVSSLPAKRNRSAASPNPPNTPGSAVLGLAISLAGAGLVGTKCIALATRYFFNGVVVFVLHLSHMISYDIPILHAGSLFCVPSLCLQRKCKHPSYRWVLGTSIRVTAEACWVSVSCEGSPVLLALPQA